MNKNNTLSCIEIEPSAQPILSIIWLHGLGADGNDFTPIVPELNLPKPLNVRFIFPNAPIRPVTINNGYQMRAWYDITSIGTERTSDTAGIMQSVNDIQALIDQELSNGLTSDQILLAGFSQGAAIALTTFLGYPQPLAGVIALSGYLPMQEITLQHAKTVNRQTPIFIAHGTEDMIVPHALGKSMYTALTEAGYAPSWHSYTMGHAVCQEEIRDIGHFINWLINQQRQATAKQV